MNRPSLYRAEPDEVPDFEVPHPAVTAADQIAELEGDLKRTEDDFLSLPFSSLSGIVGGIPQGEVWYIGAFSGDGKTAFLTSLTLALAEAGKRVYYVPTETPGRVIRAHLACKAIGYDVGDFLSGAYLSWPDAQIARGRVLQEARKFGSPLAAVNVDAEHRVLVAESGFLSPVRIEAEAAIAAELGADVVIWDHADHSDETGTSPYATSMSTQKAIHRSTHAHGLRSLPSTQFNLDAVKGNRTARYMAPREGYVYMGNIKRHLCDGMIGLYRPLKLRGLDTKLVAAYRDGDASISVQDILEPNTMCAYMMKHRKYGAREGQRAYLHVHRGRVQDFTDRDAEALSHGISTTTNSLFHD